MPAWSPDGSRIAFAQTQYYTYDILIVNSDGTGLRRLANALDASDPAWSPDGNMISYGAFSNSRGLCWDLTGPNYNCNLFIRTVAIDGSSSFVPPIGTPAYDATWRR